MRFSIRRIVLIVAGLLVTTIIVIGVKQSINYGTGTPILEAVKISNPNTNPNQSSQNQPKIIQDDMSFHVGSLKLISAKLTGKTDIWVWGYDGEQKGRLTLFFSNNNGKTWNKITGLSDAAPGMFPGPDGLPFQEIAAGSFLNATTGWLAWVKDGTMTTVLIHDHRNILNTTHAAVPASAAVVQSLNFINSTDGYALLTGQVGTGEEQRFLMKTIDGAQHWSLIAGSTIGQLPKEDTAVNLSMWANGSGWLYLNEHQSFFPILYQTSNEGKNWSKVQLPIGNSTQKIATVTGISIPVTDDKGNLTIVTAITGQNSKYQITFHSSNNGQSWVPVVSDDFTETVTDYDLPLFNFVTPTIGYSVKGFDLYRTNDGGESWILVSDDSLKKEAQGYAGSINEIHFENEERGYLVLNGNDYARMILLTSNGGRSWTRLH